MTGREAELKELKQILDNSQEADKIAVSITGIGGIGYGTILVLASLACEMPRQIAANVESS